jgi:hypothetical protein
MENKGTNNIQEDENELFVPKEISKTEAIIYDWVYTHFGRSEAIDPSWNIGVLAEHIEKCKDLDYKQKYTVMYQQN